MEWVRVLGSRLRGLFGKKRLEDELTAEIHAHLEELAEENLRKGMSAEEARYEARREFGGIEQTKELYREARGLPLLDALYQDLRFSWRMLLKNKGFAIVAVLTLAVGIGATSAVFSVVDRILFRSLPYPQAERLVSFGFKAPLDSSEFMLGTDYLEWRDQQTAFESMTTMRPGVADCDLSERNPLRLSCAAVDANFLSTFGIQPILGRSFTREEDRPKAPPVALIAFGLWRTRFGGDGEIIGKAISLDGRLTTIVGVLPESFEMPTLSRVDFLIPEALDEAAQRRPNSGAVLRAFARLKPGASLAQAAAALQPLFEHSLQFVPPQFRKEVSLRVRSLRDRQVHDARLASWILLGAVLAVLLVACTNVANLLLARASARERELAVRTALGATRSRLIRQALTESLVLGLLGGAAGCWVAYLLVRWFVYLGPDDIPQLQQAGLDGRVVGFTFGVSLVCGILFGLASAWRQPGTAMLTGKEARATTRGTLRQLLVAVQIAASLVLLSGAGLLLHSLWNLESVTLGIQPENLVIGRISLPDYRYPNPTKQLALFQRLATGLRPFAGTNALAVSDSLPPAGAMRSTIYSRIEVAGRPLPAEGTGGMVGWRAVTPDYFSALQIPVVRGRAFNEQDNSATENPIIVNESLAKKLFPNEDPLGKNMRFAMTGPWRTIVGIAANVKNNGLAEEADPEFYIPWKPDPVADFHTGNIILRSSMGVQTVAAWMRAQTASLDPALPIEIQTMNARVRTLEQRPKFTALLLSLFAATGLLLAAIGVYGVVSYIVAQRTQEIGIRMALGASSQNILEMVLLQLARWTVVGALLGMLASWYASRLLQSLLFGVQARDPLVLSAAAFVLLGASFVSSWIPARRATHVDPLVALRYE
jgi:putative ABC transport system permease protein